MSIELTRDELSIFPVAIDWAIHQQFYRSKPPAFTEQEQQQLRMLISDICQHLHSQDQFWNAQMDDTTLVVHDRILAQGQRAIVNLRTCLGACYAEIGHSATEVSAVTGLPSILYSSLLDRVSKLGDEAGVTANE